MKNKWKLIIALIIIAFFSIGILYLVDKEKKNNDINKEHIVLGSTLPLTGNSAVWGVPTKEGIKLALELYNEKGGYKGHKVKVIFEDTKGDPKTGVTAINKLISTDKVIGIIDNSNSAVTLAMAPIANKNKVILLPTGSSSPDITNAGEYIFRIWNSDALEGEIMASYIFTNEKIKTVGILVVNNSYGLGLSNVYKEKFTELGGKISDEEFFDEKESNFKTYISKLLKTNPEGIYIICYPKQGAEILKELKELGNKSKLFGAVAFEDNQLLELAGDAADGLKFPLPSPVDTTNVNYKYFKKNFEQKFHKKVPFLAAEGYDGFNVIMKAIELSGSYKSGDDIKNGLTEIKGYQGVSGLIKFDKNGDVHKPYGIRMIKNSKFAWYIPKYK